jgi:hypothetical protein
MTEMTAADDRPIARTLDGTEKRDLKRLEAIVARHLRTFVEVGNALAEIRDRKLYRETHDTFEGYCRERWEIVASRARQLIDASRTVSNLESVTTVTQPQNERQIRPLIALAPDQQREAWRRAVETAPDGKVTAAHVESVARDYREPVPAPESEDWTLDDAIEYLGSTMYEISQRWPQQYLGAMVGQLRSLADELAEYGELRA